MEVTTPCEDICNGSIVPFAKTKGLYFDDTPEPQNQEFELAEEIGKEKEKEGKLVLYIGGHDAIKYYEGKYSLMEECSGFKIKKNYHDHKLHLETVRTDNSLFL